MANLRANNLSGTGGRNAIKGSVFFSGYVEGDSSDYLYIQDSDDLDISTGDFTFEAWVKPVEHMELTLQIICQSFQHGRIILE